MDRYSNLSKIIDKYKPKSILEIGTWNGNHAKQMIIRAQTYHKNSIQYMGFDLFEEFAGLEDREYCLKKIASYEEVKKKLESTGGKIILTRGNTKDTLWNTWIPPMDFIFIDGGHSLETIKSDWEAIQKAIYFKTIILFDDYYHSQALPNVGCKTLIDCLVEEKYWKIQFLTPIDECNGGTQMVCLKMS